MGLKPSYYEILKIRGGDWISTYVGGRGKCEELDIDIVEFLKDNNKRFKEQEEKKPLEGPEYE